MTPPDSDQGGDRPLPLTGVRVLDFGQALQGPYASFLLAMAGAEVIKVESPAGEMMRSAGKLAAYVFELNNTRKKSMVIDLKADGGKDVVYTLAANVDVVLENFAPGVMDRLGIGANVLMKMNPKLVYASGNGYGRNSRRRDDVAMDSSIQAMAGVMAATGDPDGPPMRAGLPVADIISGTHLYGAIVTALYEAKVTGIGRVTEVAMLEAMFQLSTVNMGVWYLNGRTAPPRYGNRHGLMAPHDVYPTRSGPVHMMCSTDRHWEAISEIVSPDDMARNHNLATRFGRIAAREEVESKVAAWMAARDREDVLVRFREARVPIAPVRATGELLADEDLRKRGFLHDIDHPDLGSVPMATSALRFEGSDPMIPTPAAALGADTDAILRTIGGMDRDYIAVLRARRVVA